MAKVYGTVKGSHAPFLCLKRSCIFFTKLKKYFSDIDEMKFLFKNNIDISFHNGMMMSSKKTVKEWM